MYDRMNRLITALTSGLYEREEAVRLGLLVSMAGESLFLLGAPGVGKSLIARRLQMVFRDATSFTYLMGRFSTPDEVFGPLSIKRLRQDDKYERVTTNYLPDADVVFLDEIWKASAPIRNALLTALNERLYRNGTQEIHLPLKVFIGASNELPEDDETAAAFWDRFLVRLVLGPVTDAEAFGRLVSDTSDVYADVIADEDKITPDEYLQFQQDLLSVEVPDEIVALLLEMRRELNGDPEGSAGAEPDVAEAATVVSDRRWKKVVRLLRASALLHGRSEIQPLDCAIVRHCVWNLATDRERANRIVRDALSHHAAHPHVLESLAERLEEAREQLLSATVEQSEEELTEPVVYRDEYYRIVNEEEPTTILVWHGDIDELDPDASMKMDIFRYDAEHQLVGSEEVTARRTGEWQLDVAGKTLSIETRTRTGTVTRSRSLPEAEKEQLAKTVQGLIDSIQAHTDRLLAERDEIGRKARAHLFVSAEYARIVTAAIEDAALKSARTRLSAEELLADLNSS